MIADLLDSDCAWMPPTTWWCKGSDGQYLLITHLELHRTMPGIPVDRVRLPTGVLVLLADDRGQAVDSDGDPTNGMTPLITLDDGDHLDGLRAAGYELED